MTPSVIPTQHVALIQHLETFVVAGVIVVGFLVAAIYWLWRRYRVRRPKDPKQ